ncbi:G-protein coupled receptor 98 [Mizuhopecten yessoensis]|uniref:G-protein coupled receptor 98 n=2 Tax=Mizuhopecten yessoensis TaxID=6573 RepID=A0A210Q9K3_MIZYE|nr:G-protein coupled receptor 98 [Mizuhopecten yessoensis]
MTYSVSESAGTVSFQLSRTGGLFGSVTVSWSTHDGTARYPSDFSRNSGVATFGNGQSTTTFSIGVVNDQVYESNESFTVTLSVAVSSTNVVIGTRREATVTITNDDAPCGGKCGPNARCDLTTQTCICNQGYRRFHGSTCQLPCGGPCGPNERCDSVTNQCVCIERYFKFRGSCVIPCGGPCGPNAQCDRVSNQCVCNTGYIRFQRACTLPCGGKCPSNSVCSSSDNRCHCNHGFQGDPYHDGCHLRSVVEFGQLIYTVSESAGTLSLQLRRTGGLFGSVTVSWSTQNGNANYPSDFSDNSGVATFGNGQSTTTFTIGIVNDQTYESPEAFKVTLSVSQGSNTNIVVIGERRVATVTIISDDPPCGGPCGLNARCDVHSQKCVCIEGYTLYDGSCQLPCGGPCGQNAYCNQATNQCVCNTGYFLYHGSCALPCNGACVYNAYCDKGSNTCKCNHGLVGDPTKKCGIPCDGRCGSFPHSHCDHSTNRCACDTGYAGNPYGSVGCVCNGGHSGGGGGGDSYVGGSSGGSFHGGSTGGSYAGSSTGDSYTGSSSGGSFHGSSSGGGYQPAHVGDY